MASPTDAEINSVFRTLVVKGIGAIPYAGKIIGPITEYFWHDPSADPDAPWKAIQAQAKEMCTDLISEDNIKELDKSFQGFKDDVNLYTKMNMGTKKDKLNELTGWCTLNRYHFYSKDEPWTNFSTFVPFATFQVSLLRDQRFFYKDLTGEDDKNAALSKATLEEMVKDYTEAIPKIRDKVVPWRLSKISDVSETQAQWGECFNHAFPCRQLL